MGTSDLTVAHGEGPSNATARARTWVLPLRARLRSRIARTGEPVTVLRPGEYTGSGSVARCPATVSTTQANVSPPSSRGLLSCLHGAPLVGGSRRLEFLVTFVGSAEHSATGGTLTTRFQGGWL